MCGIAGIIDHSGIDVNALLDISKTLAHRGPDDEGFWLLDSSGEGQNYRDSSTVDALSSMPAIREAKGTFHVGLVHRRLSILDLSEAGHQPMQDHLGDLMIVHNGEIYNYKEIRKELEGKQVSFHSDTDTEVILNAYAYWGPSCVDKFIGMWAFAIFDRSRQKLFLSRDRFGIKPLYYYSDPSFFVFASEIKALLKFHKIQPLAATEQVIEYLVYGINGDDEKTLFKNVLQVLPGSNLEVSLQDLKSQSSFYYDLKENATVWVPGNEKEVFSNYRNLLEESIALHLRADVPVGTSLSGGLDSSAIVALAAPMLGDSVFKTFTAAYKDPKVDESSFASLVADAHANVKPHLTFPQAMGYWEDLDRLAWHQDLPFNSTTMFAQWEVMKLARKNGMKVLLDGQGADETLGGYFNFAGIFLIEEMKKGKLTSFLRNRKQLRERLTPNIDVAIGRAGYYFLPHPLMRFIRHQKRLGSHFIAESYKGQLNQIQQPERGGKSYRELSIKSVKYGLQSLLRYEDRNSMAFSIESRVPFLDHRLVAYSISLPNHYKMQDGWSKYVLRKTIAPIVDPKVVWRKGKYGYLTPQHQWKKELSKHLLNYFSTADLPPVVSRENFKTLTQSDFDHPSHLSEFWKLVSFLKWAEVFQVQFE